MFQLHAKILNTKQRTAYYIGYCDVVATISNQSTCKVNAAQKKDYQHLTSQLLLLHLQENIIHIYLKQPPPALHSSTVHKIMSATKNLSA